MKYKVCPHKYSGEVLLFHFTMLWLLLIPLAIACASAWEPNAAAYPTHVVLDSEDRFHLYWSVDKVAEVITFEVHVASTGWFGLGFSPKGGMAGADIVTGWVKDGVPYLIDRHAKQNGFPSQDKHNDYIIVGAKQTDSHIFMAFQRNLDTCDDEDFVLADDTTRVLYAIGLVIPTSENDIVQHLPHNRGARSVFFMDLVTKDPPKPEDALILEFLSENVTVPEDWDTMYWCITARLPQNLPKHHMIRYEPVIQPGNEPYVHHFILYSCELDMSEWAGKQEPCFDKTMTNFSAMFQCSTKFLAGWAVGSEAHIYPDDVGFPMFESDGDKFVMLEVHYDNHALEKNIVDNSGIRLYLTTDLRPKEAGTVTMGNPVGPIYQIIPPDMKYFTSYGICNSECTKNFPAEGLQVFSGLMHTHLLGAKVRLRHIRNGKELKPLFEDNNYDFNYQEPRIKRPTVTVLPGDEFIVECVLDSTSRKATTFSGFGTWDEMCLIFVEYFPRTDYSLDTCMSFYDYASLGLLGAKNVTDTQVQDKAGNWKYVKAFVNQEVQWGAEFPGGKTLADKWLDITRDGHQYVYCSAKADPGKLMESSAEDKIYIERTREGDRIHKATDELSAEVLKSNPFWVYGQNGLPVVTKPYKPPQHCQVKPPVAAASTTTISTILLFVLFITLL